MREARFIPYRPGRRSLEDMKARSEDLFGELDARRSVRMFSGDPVPRQLIESAIRTASMAPSGAHQQPWTFVAISDIAMKRRIRVAAEAEELMGRPAHERPFVVFPIGYPADDAVVPDLRHKDLSEIAVFDPSPPSEAR